MKIFQSKNLTVFPNPLVSIRYHTFKLGTFTIPGTLLLFCCQEDVISEGALSLMSYTINSSPLRELVYFYIQCLV